MKKSTWMPDYYADLRTWCPRRNRIVNDRVPMQLIHEVVAVLLQHGYKEKLLETGNMDPKTLEHLLHCSGEAMCELLGIGIWGDGAPTQWDRNETMDVISISFPGIKDFANLRIPLVVLPHSRVCAETWIDFFRIVKWSLVILATGRWPTRRHDGTPWNASDKCREKARPLLRGALVEVRQDWKFAVEVFGFPAHNTVEGCCWKCTCTPQEVFLLVMGPCTHVYTPQEVFLLVMGPCTQLSSRSAAPSFHLATCMHMRHHTCIHTLCIYI